MILQTLNIAYRILKLKIKSWFTFTKPDTAHLHNTKKCLEIKYVFKGIEYILLVRYSTKDALNSNFIFTKDQQRLMHQPGIPFTVKPNETDYGTFLVSSYGTMIETYDSDIVPQLVEE